MSVRLPIVDGFASPDVVFAWRRGRAIPVSAFIADVRALAARLPDRGHVLNVAADRYRFAVGIAAALCRGQVSLLPPSTQPATIAQLVARFPDAYCLAEAPVADIDLPQTIDDRSRGDAGRDDDVPTVAADATVAYVFTSGSTGRPTLHAKRWGSLVVNVRAEADRLGCLDDGPQAAIVATVPAQHMYGFESSLWMAMQGGQALVAERPFYPADIAAALAAVPAPRMLVTTPFHLRALVDGVDALPPVDRIVCATAPLSTALAAEAERASGGAVLEIYGCTETGQLASRRTTDGPSWKLLGDVALAFGGDGAIASGGHVDQPTLLGDIVEPEADFATSRRFRLVGRSADLVNIAGKRTSLAYLDLQLQAIDGVVDGAFVRPDDDAATRDGVTRLAAVVVAPTLDAARLAAALRARIDPAFVPRPIHFVDRLPRTDTGKVTHATLQSLIAAAAAPGVAKNDASSPRDAAR